jgi:transcriptional regulator with XRE-family HTH domain
MLRDARARCGATQVELADKLGIRQTDISKTERGVRRLDVLELRAWVSALGVSFADFASELDERLAATEMLQRQAVSRRNRPGTAKGR